MSILTVTPAQAQRLAHHLACIRDAESHFVAMLSTLTLGTPVDGTRLVDINTDTGALEFHVTLDGGPNVD